MGSFSVELNALFIYTSIGYVLDKKAHSQATLSMSQAITES